MKKNSKIYNRSYDLTNCDEEPLRYIQRIQDYAELIVLNKSMDKWICGTERLCHYIEEISLHTFLTTYLPASIFHGGTSSKKSVIELFDVKYTVLITPNNEEIIVELEPILQDSHQYSFVELQQSILQVSTTSSFETLLDNIVEEVYNITKYDRIMIYEFDELYNGHVVREKNTGFSTDFLGLKFPHTDIPPQARALFFEEKIRLITDTATEQKTIIYHKAHQDKEINLTHVFSRGVSPIHLEYLHNIGVNASFSVAIIENDTLWGLIACHNSTKSLITHERRTQLKFLSELISINLGKVRSSELEKQRLESKLNQTYLLRDINSSNELADDLIANQEKLKTLFHFSGLYIHSGKTNKGSGILPPDEHLDQLINKLNEQEAFDVIQTSNSRQLVGDEYYHDNMAGVLAIQVSEISKNYLLFFRQPETKEVVWAGNPADKFFNEDKGRMSPRKSFEKWRNTVQDESIDWSNQEISIARNLKAEMNKILFEQYNKLRTLNYELEKAYEELESFSYTVSHDLKAPLRSISGFATILKEDYEQVLDENGLELLDVINKSVKKMNTLIRDILNYSNLQKSGIQIIEIDLNELIVSEWETAISASNKPSAQLHFSADAPVIHGELTMIRQVFSNLFSNSLKYVAKGVTPEISIRCKPNKKQLHIDFEDNGIGVPPYHVEKIFDIFKRVVDEREYEGSGVGLAIVKKIINRHASEIHVVPSETGGSIFKFHLPLNADFFEIVNNRTEEQ